MKPPTPTQLQERIDELLKINTAIGLRGDTEYKRAEKLEDQIPSSLHWKEAVFIVVAVSIFVFVLGFNIGLRVTMRGEQEIKPATSEQKTCG